MTRVFIAAAVLLASAVTAMADSQREMPSAAFCMAAKALRDAAGSEKAAEDAARQRGVSEETISKAKRCKR